MSASAPPRSPRPGLRAFALDHDDRWSFVVPYVALALVLSIFVSLFWLLAVVLAHVLLEWIKHRELGWPRAPAVWQAAWEAKLDLALVLFALALAVTLDVSAGVAGVGSAVRLSAASRVMARLAGWQSVLKGVLLSADDAAQVARALVMRRRLRRGAAAAGGAVEAEPAAAPPRPRRFGGWSGRWRRGDVAVVAFGALCLLAIPGVPWLAGRPLARTLAVLAQELAPLP